MSGGELLMVPLTGSSASFRALAVAGIYAKQRKAKVLATYVVEVGHALPIDAEMDTECRTGELVLRKAEQLAGDQHFQIESTLVQARSSGRAVLDEARRRQASIIVLGVGGAGPENSFDPGSTASYLLRRAPCEVWLIREEQPAS